MSGFVDLHCHWIAEIDDGARSVDEGLDLLERLHAAGFDRVIATPHMRPGMFDNTADMLTRAFERMQPHVRDHEGLPEVGLSSEHYFDDIVYERLLAGRGLPYPGGRAVLLEFYEIDFPPTLEHRFFDLRRRRLLPVIAHPERYRCLWKSTARLERLVDLGAVALLDTAALVGKYGRKSKRCAEELLDRGLYHAACSDAHRPRDVDAVEKGMSVIQKRYGADELDFLFRRGPLEILAGSAET